MDSISLKYSLIIIIISSFLSCKNFSDLNKETNMKEKNNDELMYRPNIHFAPQKKHPHLHEFWMHVGLLFGSFLIPEMDQDATKNAKPFPTR